MDEHFKRRLLFPIPHSPKTANDGVLPVATPCCNARRKASMWLLRPTNSSGLAGKFGSGITCCSFGTKVTNGTVPFVPTVPFSARWAGHDEQRRDAVTHRAEWMEF